MTKVQLKVLAWALGAVVATITVVAWGDTYAWRLSRLSLYQVFPLLGLMAFSLMWTHYIMGALRRYFRYDKKVLHLYFEVTATIALALILLHPGLLAGQLWLDGEGLPPGSELNYVVPTARWAVLFGFLSLGIFLLYELRRKFENKGWWRFVQYASDAAMVLIFFHALKLGGVLQIGWFRIVWYVYGVTLLGALIYVYWCKKKH